MWDKEETELLIIELGPRVALALYEEWLCGAEVMLDWYNKGGR